MWQRELVRDLKEASTRERKAVIARYNALYGYSKEHLYRIAREHGWNSGRQQRSDKGICTLAEEQIDFVGAFVDATRRENKGAFTPIANALDFAETNGIIKPGEVSVSTITRNLRERAMSKAQLNAPTPHTNMRSLHPNHVHGVDASTCIQFYLKDGCMGIMEEGTFYKNKVENFKKIDKTLQRYILADHFSSFFFVYYYESAGETAENLFDFLYRAWETKSDTRFPFQGPPKILLADGGTRAKAKAMGAGFWEGLDVDILPGKTGNSRRQGCVETLHNYWEEWFEARLRIEPATSIEELNRKAFGFCLWMNATRKHTRTKMTRLSCWMTIKADQLRILPERAVLQDLMNKPEETRTVTNHRISFEGKEFNLKHANIPHGSKVKVIKNIWKWKDGIVTISWNNALYEAKAIELLPAELGGFEANAPVIGENFKAQPETMTQKAKKRLSELATGSTEPDKKRTPFEGLNVFDGYEDRVANLVTIPKKGQPIELSRPEAPIIRPIMELFKRLRAENIAVTKDLNAQLRDEFGGTIALSDIDRVLDRFRSGGAPQRETTRPVLQAIN